MPKHSTSSPMPTRMAITLKNARAFRAAATFRMGRTCSDIRCLSCFAKGSGRVLVGVLVIVLVFVVNHPPPHVRSEQGEGPPLQGISDRKSTRLNSSHLGISYAVFCLKKKK